LGHSAGIGDWVQELEPGSWGLVPKGGLVGEVPIGRMWPGFLGIFGKGVVQKGLKGKLAAAGQHIRRFGMGGFHPNFGGGKRVNLKGGQERGA